MDNRNLFLAIVLSVAILAGFEFFFPSTPQAPATTAETAQVQDTTPTAADAPEAAQGARQAQVQAGAAPADLLAATGEVSIDELLTQDARVSITSPSVTGSISLKGGRIDDLILNGYNESQEPDSAKVRLLNPRGALNSYFAEFGWVGSGIALPDQNTLWTADRTVLDPNNPVTLSWDNGQGLTFTRTIALDKDFMFTINQRVENNSAAPVTLNPYGLISRWSTPDISGFYILHEGPLGVFDQTLEEVDYSDLVDEKQTFSSTGGWVGFTDKYWLAALIPAQDAQINATMRYSQTGMLDKYQTDFVGAALTVPAGGSADNATKFFAGAKRVTLLDSYEKNQGITNFDLAIDFGVFYFLTKPIFYAMSYIYDHIGNFGIAILLLTVGIKAVLFPLANKSYVAMSKMKKLGPEIKKLQERFKDDKMRLNQEMMALYKKEKANPAAGCLPILVQIPIFFALYKVLFVTIEMRHAPFFGWIHDLSAPDPASIWTAFGLIDWNHLAYVPQFLDIGIWPIIMGFTMWLQQRLNPQPTDPMQAKLFFYLPFIFTFMLAAFPAGLVIYWAWNNTLSIAQQWVIMRRMGVKVGD